MQNAALCFLHRLGSVPLSILRKIYYNGGKIEAHPMAGTGKGEQHEQYQI